MHQLVVRGVEMEAELVANGLDLLVEVGDRLHDFGFAAHVAAEFFTFRIEDAVQEGARPFFDLVESVVGHLCLHPGHPLRPMPTLCSRISKVSSMLSGLSRAAVMAMWAAMKRLSLNSLTSRFEARIMASVYLHQLVVKSGISLSSAFIFQPPKLTSVKTGLGPFPVDMRQSRSAQPVPGTTPQVWR
jgi:hypothetical protein